LRPKGFVYFFALDPQNLANYFLRVFGLDGNSFGDELLELSKDEFSTSADDFYHISVISFLLPSSKIQSFLGG